MIQSREKLWTNERTDGQGLIYRTSPMQVGPKNQENAILQSDFKFSLWKVKHLLKSMAFQKSKPSQEQL